MWTPRKALFVAGLVLYGFGLIISAFWMIPVPDSFRSIYRVARDVRRVYHLAGIPAGNALFVDLSSSPNAMKSPCVRITGTTAEGALVPVFATERFCDGKGYIWAVPPREKGILRILYDAFELQEYHRRYDGQMLAPPGQTLGRRRLEAIAHHFCRQNPNLVRLDGIFDHLARDIYTGTESRVFHLSFQWTCRDSRFESLKWGAP